MRYRAGNPVVIVDCSVAGPRLIWRLESLYSGFCCERNYMYWFDEDPTEKPRTPSYMEERLVDIFQ